MELYYGLFFSNFLCPHDQWFYKDEIYTKIEEITIKPNGPN